MKDGLESFLDRLQQAATLEHLQLATEELRVHYGIAHVVYYWVNSQGERYGAGTFTQEWVDRYLEQDYLRVDPAIIGGLQRFDAYDWKELDWSTRAARVFLKDAIKYGVGNQGITVPMHGPLGQYAIFTVSATCDDETWESFLNETRRELILVAHEFNRKALEFERGEADSTIASLSPRELAAMTFLAKGLSRAQAAEQMDISEHTLRVYIEAARHKLGALNTTHAVARALSRGMIVV